jgi:hypothetical protein
MNRLLHCILTSYQFDKAMVLEPTDGDFIEYDGSPAGKVRIAFPTLIELMNKRDYNHPILAGICRNLFEKEEEPPLITTDFITNGIKNFSIPKSFKEKALHLLKYIYDKGGNDYKTFNFSSPNDYPLCYAENHDEFTRIMIYLEENFFLKWKNSQIFPGGLRTFWDTQLLENGIELVEKDLPNIPMIGLVDQEISTGDIDIDEKINHAKELFFQEPQSIDRMRSSCETLSHILEPLRKEAKKYFAYKDIEDFFQIVNNFDVRHNKDTTKKIIHPEQLEWIFYSLLNTINTYTKLKQRLE